MSQTYMEPEVGLQSLHAGLGADVRANVDPGDHARELDQGTHELRTLIFTTLTFCTEYATHLRTTRTHRLTSRRPDFIDVESVPLFPEEACI